MAHTVLVRLKREGGVDELRTYRIGGRQVFRRVLSHVGTARQAGLHGVGQDPPYDDAIVEAIDGHRLYDGQATVLASNDPWWFNPNA